MKIGENSITEILKHFGRQRPIENVPTTSQILSPNSNMILQLTNQNLIREQFDRASNDILSPFS